MAISMRTFGNTLSELQAGANADKGLDYQRANAQDAINQQRLESFLRLQGQKFQTQAQQNELAASRAQRMAELIQQGKSDLEVAKVTAGGRIDPRVAGLKLEQEQEEADRKALSAARMKIAEEMRVLEQWKAKNAFDFGDPNDLGTRWTSRRYGELRDILARMDADAKALGLSPSGYGGYAGYDVATPNLPVITPDANVVSPPAAVPVIPVTPAPTPAPAATGAAWMGMGGMLPSAATRTVAPVPPMLQPRVSGGGTNYFDFSNGALIPR